MARGINKVILIGNLGDDPTVRTTASGICVANLSMVTNEQHKNTQTGVTEELAQWHKVVLWGKTAEVAQKFLKKGAQVFIEGKIQTKSFTDKTGVKRFSTEIVAEQMQMLGYKYNQEEKITPYATNDVPPPEHVFEENKPYQYLDENFDYKSVSTTIDGDTEIPF